MKSTVPVGTGDKVRAALDARGLTHVGYVSNPEFLAEGTAVKDFLEPDRIVIGSFDDADGDAVERLHDGLDAPIVRTDVPSAEMVKLAANAYLGDAHLVHQRDRERVRARRRGRREGGVGDGAGRADRDALPAGRDRLRRARVSRRTSRS